MIQEEKDLVFKDLCGRLPYGVKINVKDDANGLDYDTNLDLVHLAGFGVSKSNEMKPYLRPLLSMTDEEREDYSQFIAEINGCACFIDPISQMDWLNKNMFDYRELIPNGMALEAPNEMYDS